MRLLLTRPRAESERLASRLAAMGHETVIAPLTAILLGEAGERPPCSAMMLTSANALPAVLHWPKEAPCFCVGPRTAEAARQAGFSRVIEAEGDGAALVARLKTEGFSPGSTIVHPCGADKAMDYGAALADLKLAYCPVEVYSAQAAKALPQEAASALRQGTCQGVLHYSPRAARLFAALCESAGLTAQAAGLDHYCLSPAVAQALGRPYSGHIFTAYIPNKESLLSLLLR